MGVEADCVMGDRAYDGSRIRGHIADMGAEAAIPPHSCRKASRTFDRHLCEARHATADLFARLKQNRRLATR